MSAPVRVRVPASTANLGPGFDCLGLTLDLWNEAAFIPTGEGIEVSIEGEGKNRLPVDRTNLVAYAFRLYYRHHQIPLPPGLRIACRNNIPSGSGMGSSASGALLGLLGACALSGQPASAEELLVLAAAIEGHADNAAAALYGGLTVTIATGSSWLVRRFDVPRIQALLVLPDFHLPTQAAREALPKQVSLADAVFNLGRTALVVEAFTSGDLDLLCHCMEDHLHQPYRLKLVPGGDEAMAAARAAGAAVALSGAGPSLIAFCGGDSTPVGQAMQNAFERAGVRARVFQLQTTSACAQIIG
jgi:homoserine kinase